MADVVNPRPINMCKFHRAFMVNPAPLMDRKLICAGILSMNREVLSVADKIVSVVNGPVLSGGLFDPIIQRRS